MLTRFVPTKINELAKTVIAASLYSSGYYTRLFQRQGKRAIVLMYHRITDTSIRPSEGNGRTAFELGISKENFETQMRFIKEQMGPVSLTEIVRALKNGRSLPENAVAITFDDGYRDNYENAFPILRRLGIPATFFVTTGYIETPELPWWDRIYDAVRPWPHESIPVQKITSSFLRDRVVGMLPEFLNRPDLPKSDVQHLVDALKKIDPRSRNKYIQTLEDVLEVRTDRAGEAQSMLTWTQIREMSRNNMTIAAHTVSHPILSRCTPDQAKSEIRESITALEKQLGEPVRGFAYPEGKADTFNSDTVRILMELGVEYACATEPGFVDRESDPYALPRVGLSNESLPRALRFLARELNLTKL
jgi:peptidoglycan/xylan/chitin deacetylase (PgdA/CDA1 family)